MDPISAAVMAGGSMLGQHMANRANVAQARDQMRFQKMMSNTSYQRAMKDMRKAGLNPILAAKVGGASTPAGAMANIGNIIQPGVEAYQKISSAQQMHDTTESTVALNAEKMGLTQAQANNLAAQTQAVLQDTKLKKILHDERWPRQFATMSKENIVASMLAVMHRIPVEDVLKGQGVTHQSQIKGFLNSVREMDSLIAREGQGAAGTVRDIVGLGVEEAEKLYQMIQTYLREIKRGWKP